MEHHDKNGFTPLILATSGGFTDICRMLLEAGAQVDACVEKTKDTGLSMACSGGRKEVIIIHNLLLRTYKRKQ
jgi:ankyrin repeat protein